MGCYILGFSVRNNLGLFLFVPARLVLVLQKCMESIE